MGERRSLTSLEQRVDDVASIAALHAADVDQQSRFPREAIGAARELRLLGSELYRPERARGESLRTVATACARIAHGCGATGMIFAMHHLQLFCLLRHGAQHPWVARFLARQSAENLLLASSTTEDGKGGDLGRSHCCVEPIGEMRRVRKDGAVISYGEEADAVLVTARRSADAAASDQVLACIIREDLELERITAWSAMGMRGTCSHTYRLDGRFSPEQVVAVPFATIRSETMTPAAHILWAAVWIGIARGAAGKARAFARRRGAGNGAAAGRRLGIATSQLQSATALLERAIDAYDEALQGGTVDAALLRQLVHLKIAVSELTRSTCLDALQSIGIAGYSTHGDQSVERNIRDICSASIMINNDKISEYIDDLNLIIETPGIENRFSDFERGNAA